MSDSDSFIREVSEEVRKDRMYALWKKWGPFVFIAIAIVVAGAAYWSWGKTRDAAAAAQRGEAILAADPTSVEAQQALIEKLAPPSQLVPTFTAAATMANAGDTAKAAEAYRAIAAREDLARLYRDMAMLQALRLEAVEGDAGTVLADLAPLTEEGAPYAPLARELAAALHIRAGDIEAARNELTAILASAQATSALKLRAREMLMVIGGADEKDAS